MSAPTEGHGAGATAARGAAAAAGALGGVSAPILGVGVDAVDVARFRAVLARRPGFAARFFSAAERADAGRSKDPAESLAARFAAKEAVMKALGTGLGGFALTDVEVTRADAGEGQPAAERGAPSLVLRGDAAALADHKAARLHLSLTHTSEIALAFVVAERATTCCPS